MSSLVYLGGMKYDIMMLQVEGRSKAIGGRKWEEVERERGGDEKSSEGERC